MSTLDLDKAAALPETPDLDGAYPRLSQAQLDTLMAHGTRRPTHRGEYRTKINKKKNKKVNNLTDRRKKRKQIESRKNNNNKKK